MFFSKCWDFTTCVKYQLDSLPLGFGIKTQTSAVMEFVFPLSRIYCDDNKSPATRIELLFPLSASSSHPLMSPFPALSHNALKTLPAWAIVNFMSWMTWSNFPRFSAPWEKVSHWGWEGRDKNLQRLLWEKWYFSSWGNQAEFRWWQMMLAAFEKLGHSLLILISITANMFWFYITKYNTVLSDHYTDHG